MDAQSAQDLALNTLTKLREAYEAMAMIYHDDLSWAAGAAAIDDAVDLIKYEFENAEYPPPSIEAPE
jgi:hypothetical protein